MASTTAAGYDTLTYLLDRANIEDVVRKMYTYTDMKNVEGMVNEVYAAQIEVDYGSLMGSGPTTYPAKDRAEFTVKVVERMTATQHALSAPITDLPQPGPAVQRPTECTVLANVLVTLISKEVRGGPLNSNGGLVEFGVTRDPGLEARGVNPWRISRQKANVVWESGNLAVFSHMVGQK